MLKEGDFAQTKPDSEEALNLNFSSATVSTFSVTTVVLGSSASACLVSSGLTAVLICLFVIAAGYVLVENEERESLQSRVAECPSLPQLQQTSQICKHFSDN